MINLTYEYRIEPSRQQEQRMLVWLRGAGKCITMHFWTEGLSNSRKVPLQQEYIIQADVPHPNYPRHSMRVNGFDIPVQEAEILFPQMGVNPRG